MKQQERIRKERLGKSQFDKTADKIAVGVAQKVGGNDAAKVVAPAVQARDKIEEGIRSKAGDKWADLAYRPYTFLYRSVTGKYR